MKVFSYKDDKDIKNSHKFFTIAIYDLAVKYILKESKVKVVIRYLKFLKEWDCLI